MSKRDKATCSSPVGRSPGGTVNGKEKLFLRLQKARNHHKETKSPRNHEKQPKNPFFWDENLCFCWFLGLLEGNNYLLSFGTKALYLVLLVRVGCWILVEVGFGGFLYWFCFGFMTYSKNHLTKQRTLG